MSDIVNGINTIVNTGKVGVNIITEGSMFHFLQSPTFKKFMVILASYNVIILLLENSNIQINKIDYSIWYNKIIQGLSLYATVYFISQKFILSLYLTLFYMFIIHYYIKYNKSLPLLNKIIKTESSTLTKPSTVTESSTLTKQSTVTEPSTVIISNNSKTKQIIFKLIIIFIFAYILTSNYVSVICVFLLYFINNNIL